MILFGVFFAQSMAAEIQGTITHNGDPLAYARLLAINSRISFHEVYSDALGHYSFNDLPPGKYRVLSISPIDTNALPRMYPDGSQICEGEILNLLDNEQYADVDIDLPSGAIISGQLLYTDGSPLSDAAVVATPIESYGSEGALERYAWTDTEGFFQINGLEGSLPDSFWSCSIEHEDLPNQYIGEVYDEDFSTPIEVSNNDETSIGTQYALSGISIAGQISGELNPIGPTNVHVYSSSQVKTVLSDDSGWYLVEGLPPGDLLAWATPEGHATTYSPYHDRPIDFVTVPDEDSYYDELDITSPLALTFSVGLVDVTTETPITGASVMLYNDTKTVGKGNAVDENGIAFFDNLHPGMYSIQYYAENDGYTNGTLLDEQNQDAFIEIDENLDNTLTIALSPSAKITGTIYDDRGYPVHGADVFANKGEDYLRTSTDIEGTYTLWGLQEGEWMLSAQYTPYCPYDDSYVTIYENDTPNPDWQESLSITGVLDDVLDWTLPIDNDRDEMSDYWEESYGLDTNQNDASQDPDEDGLSNLTEYRMGTHPNESEFNKESCGGCQKGQAFIFPIFLFSLLGLRNR
jgi:hypothetical protein